MMDPLITVPEVLRCENVSRDQLRAWTSFSIAGILTVRHLLNTRFDTCSTHPADIAPGLTREK
jgi:hypothetical protein